jgi:hypothetical protein
MKLSDYKKDYDALTGKASDVARHLSFAGIAIVWIFKSGEGPETSLPKLLLLGLGLFAASLFFDLLHYVIASVVWGNFHRKQEKQLTNPADDPDLTAPAYYNWPAICLFGLKLVAVLAGYVCLVCFLAEAWLA